MVIKTKRSLGPYDVPIANIQVKTVGSHDMVQLTDMSEGIAGNVEAAISSISTRPLGSGYVGNEYRFAAKNIYGEIDVTDELYDNRATGISTPLWYVHSVKRSYYNSTMTTRSVRKTIKLGHVESGRIIGGLLPSNVRSIMVFNSMVIQDATAAITLPFDAYVVNHDAGSVTIRRDYAIANHTYVLTYATIVEDLTVKAPSDSYWMFEIEQAVPEITDYFHLRILSSDSKPFEITYTSFGEDENVSVFTERTFAIPIFTEVPEVIRSGIVADSSCESLIRRAFSYENVGTSQYIKSYSRNADRLYHFRSRTPLASKIHLVKPVQHSVDDDWYLGVTTGRFIGSDYRQFQVVGKSGIGDFEDVTEVGTIVDSSTIWLSRKNIVFFITSEQEIGGIDVVRSDGTVVPVDSVDSQRGIVYLRESISQQDQITVSYRATSNQCQCTSVCFNPLLSHADHNRDVKGKVFAFFLADISGCPGSSLPVFAKPLDLYDGQDFTVYTRDYLDGNVNSATAGTRSAFRSDIIGIPADLIYSSGRLEVLGTAYLSNPLDEDGYLVEDSRIYGGGSSEYIRSAFDYGYFDGEATDLESLIRVHIPQTIVDDMIAKAMIWNPEVAVLSDPAAREELARQRVMELITAKVRKFSMLGTIQEIVIDE